MTEDQRTEIRDDLQALIDSVAEAIDATYRDDSQTARTNLHIALGAAMFVVARVGVEGEVTYKGKNFAGHAV